MRLALTVTALAFLVTMAALPQTNVVTYHNNAQRTGWNSAETVLTPAMVASNFGILATTHLDDQVDTQPLVVTNQAIQGAGTHNVVYVTTEHNTVYALDAASGAILKQRNLGAPVPLPLGCNNNGPNVGVNGTATIDAAAHTMFVITYTNVSGPEYYLHALDISTLADKPGSPVMVSTSHALTPTGSYNFNALMQRQRPALLDANGRIYAGFGSFCDDHGPDSRGWVLSFSKSTLAVLSAKELTNQRTTSNTSDCTWTGNHPCFLASVWMSGYGLASDSGGNVYFTTGNTGSGTYDSTTNLSESVVKMKSDLTAPSGFFTPADEASLDTSDNDYGSGGVLVLPDQPGAFPHLAAAAGKEGHMFVLNRDAMGGFHTPDLPLHVDIGNCWCGPSYFEGPGGARVVSSGGSQVQTWSVTTSGGKPTLTLEATSPALEANQQDPGFFTSVSSNGTAANSAVIWAVGRAAGADLHVSLYAFNATPSGGTLPLLWSGVAGLWPNSSGNSNIVPTVANGRVYVASNQQLSIFGIRPPADVTIWRSTGMPCAGSACPGWQELDNNTKTVSIVTDGTLYQLHNDGMIWQSTGVTCSGPACPGWRLLDNNNRSVDIAADSGNLYQLHNDGKIWRYTGTPCSGTFCPGWQMLDDNTRTSAIGAGGGSLYQLHNDGTIWRYTGTPCSGASCPGWQMLDNNTKSIAIAAGSSLYQLHNDGKIWRYTGTPCSGSSCPGWVMLDDNTKTTEIAASGGDLYQLHNDGMIWRFTGTVCSGSSCPGWQMLDNNNHSIAIRADGSNLYQLHNDGKVWRFTGTPCNGASCPGWQMFDDNTRTTRIASGGGQLDQLHDGMLYQLHSNGSIWRYTGAPCSGPACLGWQELDNNSRTIAIAGGGRQLFQLHKDGSIWRYTGTPCAGTSCPGWEMLDNNPQGAAITAGDQLFQLHKNGSIWRYTGTPCAGGSCPGWEELDNNPRGKAIVAAGRQIFQLHNDGSIWRYTNTPCSGASCPGWQELDNNPKAGAIAAGDHLYQWHTDGSIWRYTGTPCAGSSCPGWQELDNNPRATGIAAAGRQLFQLHNDGSIWRYTGTPCTGASCPGWQELDNNPQGGAIAAGDLLYQWHMDGSIWRYTGTPCSGASCPGWEKLDTNPAAKAIAAGRME